MLSKFLYFLGIVTLIAGLIFGTFAMIRWLSYNEKMLKAQQTLIEITATYEKMTGDGASNNDDSDVDESISSLARQLQRRGEALLGGIDNLGPLLSSSAESLLALRDLFDEALETHESFSLHANIAVPCLILSGWLCFIATRSARRQVS